MNPNLRNITNNFQDVHLVSLASWKQANEFIPRDRGGPYVITQEGYDPEDLTMREDEFILGRSGKWLSLGHFFHLPVADRRAEYVFATAGEIMQMMADLPPKVSILRPKDKARKAVSPEKDEMAKAFMAGKHQHA